MSGPSASKSKTKTRVFDPEALRGIIGGLTGFAEQQQGLAGQPRAAIGDPAVAQFSNLAAAPSSISTLQSGQLTSGEQASFEQQLGAIEAGGTGAQQRIEQSVRERTAATGFGGGSTARSSIAQEASQLGQFEQFQAQQRAGVFGQQGQLQRQGLLAGAQFGLQERGQELQLGGLRSQAQQFSQTLGSQERQFGQQQQQNQLQLVLQALQQAGGFAGLTQQTGQQQSFGFGG